MSLRVAAEVVEVPLQGVELARQVGERGRRVELVGVLGGQPERLSLALPADEDRDPPWTGGGRVERVRTLWWVPAYVVDCWVNMPRQISRASTRCS